MSKRVLVVSARMGAGHDGAAKELARTLQERGFEVEIRDFLDAAPWVGRFLERTYELQLDHAPWSYEAVFRLFGAFKPIKPPIVTIFYLLFFPRMRRWIKEIKPDAVLTTYPFASLVLGRARRATLRPMRIPAFTFLTDFSVHTMWVDEGIDNYLAVHNISVSQVERLVGKTPVVTGPAVSEKFRAAAAVDPAQIRSEFDIPTDVVTALIVAGSWGIGDLRDTLLSLGGADGIFPVVICGKNEALRRDLARMGIGLVLGWTDRMPDLMRACDVVIQNAGGLTALEAFASNTPVISYNPIKGHGLRNIIEMEAAGVSLWAKNREELIEAVHELKANPSLTTRRALGVFVSNPAIAIDHSLAAENVTPRQKSAERRPVGFALRFATLVMLAIASLNLAVNAATNQINVGKVALKTPYVFGLVSVGNQDFTDPALIARMAKLGLGAVVTGPMAQSYPYDLSQLETSGVSIINGGWPINSGLRILAPIEAATKAQRLITQDTGLASVVYAPEGIISSMDLAWASISHHSLVKAVVIETETKFNPTSGTIYEINGANLSSAQLNTEITWFARLLRAKHMSLLPATGLASLQKTGGFDHLATSA